MQSIEVSIVIPTYNRADSLQETLKSLFIQTYPINKYEIIVCDDNSSDNTEEIVNELISKTKCNLKYIKVKSKIKGPAKVRNAGINYSLGKIIGFTDDDCIVSENWIETAVECFKKNKNICGVYGTVITVGNCKDQKFTVPRKIEVLSDNGSYVTPNIFYTKEVLLDVGLFDVEMRYLQDIELGWRVRKKGTIFFEPALQVHHKVYCAPLKAFLRRQKRTEYWVLMYSKHPEHMEEDRLILGHVRNKSVFYVISSFLFTGFFLLEASFSKLFLLITIVTYLWAHVLVDNNFKKYPLRLVSLPRYSVTDLIRFMYSLRASMKYKCLVLL